MSLYRFVQITRNQENQFLDFLKRVDNLYNPPLSKKTNLQDFCYKILTLGNVIAVYDNDTIIGAICFYTNNTETSRVYISLVGVDQNYKGQHIASHLIDKMFVRVKSCGLHFIGIHTNNEIARHIYEKKGFILISSDTGIPTRHYLEYKL